MTVLFARIMETRIIKSKKVFQTSKMLDLHRCDVLLVNFKLFSHYSRGFLAELEQVENLKL